VSDLPQHPYFMRALYEWCVDSGLTPHLSVRVDSRTRVPVNFVKDGQIVLNIGPSAVRNLHMDNDWVTFSARFNGVGQQIEIPVDNVLAIFARETGAGMAFQTDAEPAMAADPNAATESSPDTPRPSGRPSLRVVK